MAITMLRDYLDLDKQINGDTVHIEILHSIAVCSLTLNLSIFETFSVICEWRKEIKVLQNIKGEKHKSKRQLLYQPEIKFTGMLS